MYLLKHLKQIYAKIDPKYGETEVRVIGTRHGEKLYETLVTREEMAKAIDMGDTTVFLAILVISTMISSLLKVMRSF